MYIRVCVTSDALIIETDHLNFKNCAIVSIDLYKAFDILDHELLIKKLIIYG